jgi:uncharacterized membrane protein/thiol-disulfide isomerase/thioredoxin
MYNLTVMNIDQNFGNSLGHVARLYAKKLNIKVTGTSLTEAFEENPYYPSLYSLGNTFDRFGIANQSARVPASELHQLEAPFIAYVSRNGPSEFVLVTETGEHVKYTTGSGKSYSVSKDAFLQSYREIVFVAEASDASGEKNYDSNLKKEKAAANKNNALIAGGLLILVLFAILFFAPLLQLEGTSGIVNVIVLTLAKLTGLGAAIVLLLYEIDHTNQLAAAFCRAGAKTNCDAVLNSKASKIMGVSWSEIGFFYFAATLLFLFAPTVAIDFKVPMMAVASTAVALFVPYSLYYQWRVIKQWCPLCLTIQVALVLELIVSLDSFWFGERSFVSTDAVSTIITLCICTLVPIVAWYFLKSVLRAAKDSKSNLAAYKRLLYNPDMFNLLLNQQAAIAEGWEDLGITIGNPKAKHTILKVCNPFCGPCAKAHPVLEAIIETNPDYNLKVIFTASDANGDNGGLVARHLMAIASKGDGKITANALDEWYTAPKKDYNSFATRFPMNGEVEQQREKIRAMHHWCELAGIAYTPTIFVDGKKLPEAYGVEELKGILQAQRGS